MRQMYGCLGKTKSSGLREGTQSHFGFDYPYSTVTLWKPVLLGPSKKIGDEIRLEGTQPAKERLQKLS